MTHKHTHQLNSQSGFTLPEVMIAIFVLALLAMGTSQFTLTTIGETFRIQQRSAAEESLLRAEYLLRRYVSLAVGPPQGAAAGVNQDSIGTLNTQAGATSMHQINLFNYNRVVQNPNNFIASIAYFVRENGSISNMQSDLWTTGIFYRLPTQTTSGALIIDTGANAANSATYQLLPDASDQVFDKFVEFDTSQSVFSGFQESNGDRNRRISALRARMVVRYFTTPHQQNWRWCPSSEPSSTPDCAMPTGSYVDLTREVTIALYNNVIGFSQQGANVAIQTGTQIDYRLIPERVSGNIYMFAPLFPAQSYK